MKQLTEKEKEEFLRRQGWTVTHKPYTGTEVCISMHSEEEGIVSDGVRCELIPLNVSPIEYAFDLYLAVQNVNVEFKNGMLVYKDNQENLQ
jgi:hypothetical protein